MPLGVGARATSDIVPALASTKMTWYRFFTEEDVAYYYDDETEATQWDEPPSWEDPVDDEEVEAVEQAEEQVQDSTQDAPSTPRGEEAGEVRSTRSSITKATKSTPQQDGEHVWVPD